ncbi:MAG: nucleoside-diphosphate sugar epimerase [Solibacillus sp.]
MLRLSLLISIGISLFGVLLIEHFFTMEPDGVANGGNLGALGLALVCPFVALSLFITFRYFTELVRMSKDALLRSIYIGFGFALLIFVTYYAIGYKNDVYTALGGDTKAPGSIIYGFPLLNEYTNRVFINFYTFAAIHLISALAGAFFGIFKKTPTHVAE